MKEITRRWFSMKASDTEAEISIFDEIGGWGVMVSDFKKELDAVKNAGSIKLYLNSPGGSVFDGMAIYNLLAPMRDKIEVHVLGLAASIASIIALAGKTMKMDTGSYYMIHDPWAFAMGTASEFRKTAGLLDQIGESMAGIYADRSNLSGEEIKTLMADETWMTAEEAVAAGFADEAIEGQAVAASCDLSKYKYQHAPAALAKASKKPVPPSTARDLEALLRDAGYSRTDALGIVAKGFSAVREGVPDEGAGSAPVTVAAETMNEPPKVQAVRSRTRARIRAAGLSIKTNEENNK